MDPRRVRSFIDDEDADEDADEDEDDGVLITGSKPIALAHASDVEDQLPPPARAPTLNAAASQQPRVEPEVEEPRKTTDGDGIPDAGHEMDLEEAALGSEATKLPPIDRGYAWIIALGIRRWSYDHMDFGLLGYIINF